LHGPLALSTSALRGPRSSDDSEMFTHADCLLLRRRVLHAFAKPTEGRWRRLWRRWRIDVFRWRWRWRIARLLVHCRASRLDYRRFPPAKLLDALVNDGQKRRETCKQAEEEIQVRVVPTHVQPAAKPK